ncbi:SGNH hydrolase-like domain-containing protein, acetyltransferase AlgX [Rhizobiales bacterium GAS113]|nr:SGNH hydrolase-like domain-containing protein, acetyltransferase AlgX [Rhizobiales bacterium GAS113]
MLAPHRRFLGAAAWVLLLLVLVGGLLPDPLAQPLLASRPAATVTGGPTARLAASLSGIKSHFNAGMNYATSMPFLAGVIDYELGTSRNQRVYIGRNHHLFYNSELAPEQSAGAVFRVGEIEHFAETADAMRRKLELLGAKLIITVPPNAQSIATESLPRWSKPRGPLEYDLALSELRQRRLATVDLRTPFRAIGGGNALYRRTDTHWNTRGAVLGFNLTMAEAGHPEWAVPSTAVGPGVVVAGGDLARFLGIQGYLTDIDYPHLPDPATESAWTKLDLLRSPPFAYVFDSWAYERKAEGERVLILGDSFTRSYWKGFLMRSDAARIGWLHHASCSVDWRDVERFQPTLVILAPTERSLPCKPEAWPAGLPGG